MRAWRVHEYGAPAAALRLEDVEPPAPGPGEVQIRVEAATLNFNDIDGVRGRYETVRPPLPYVPGMEVLGVDVATGRRVAAVPTGAHGGYAEIAVAPAAMTFEMPPAIASPGAAALLMPFHLAWLGIFERAGLRAGETVLVHAGAGGAGSAAVQLAAHAGARVIATAGSPAKTQLCEELGAAVTIDYREADFVEATLDATGGRGVDVAFDTLGGDVTARTFRCMAFGGRHVLAGFATGIEAEDQGMVPRPILFGNLSLVGVCLAYVDDPLAVKAAAGSNLPSSALGRTIHERILDLVTRGAVRPVVGLEVPFAELPAALEAMERRETTGRVVVDVTDVNLG
jgi:NADPH2:quinone reductase